MNIDWQVTLTLSLWLLFVYVGNTYAEKGIDRAEHYSLITQQHSTVGRATIILFCFAWYLPLFFARKGVLLWHVIKETAGSLVVYLLFTILALTDKKVTPKNK